MGEKYPHINSTSVLGLEKRRGVTWAMSKQLEPWLSSAELALSRLE